MSNHVKRSYYEDDVLNATPQRLRLMLIDGAIRYAKAAIEVWESDRSAAMKAMGRCRNIVIELIGGIRADRDSCEHIVDHVQRDNAITNSKRKAEVDDLETVARNVMSVYLVVFRQLDEAQLAWDAAKLQAAIGVLEEERVTMQQVCKQLPEAPILNTPHIPAEISAADAEKVLEKSPDETPRIVPPVTYGDGMLPGTGSVSFEA